MTTLTAGQRRIEVSRADKVLFPDDGITEGEFAEYHRAIGPTMLAHIRRRPLMLERYPNGIHGQRVVQKQVPSHFPDWVKRVDVPKQGGTVTHVVANDVATLVYLADQACITLHPWLSRADRLDNPDQMIIDLDPPPEVFPLVCKGARELRTLLTDLGLVPFVKSTGSRGLHVVTPLDRSAGFEEVRAFAWGIGEVLVERDPTVFTMEWRKAQREGRIYVDVLRNAYAQNAVAPYSVRALPTAPVAAPLLWEEIDEPGFHPRLHTLRTMVARLHEMGDPWAGMSRRARSLREPRRRLDALRDNAAR